MLPTVGYIPFTKTALSAEAGCLSELLGVATRLLDPPPPWNDPNPGPLGRIELHVDEITDLAAVVIEGPGGLQTAAALRAGGYAGSLTVLPYLNPRGWRDVLAASAYGRVADHRDRVWVGSVRSAGVYAALGVPVAVGEPYGFDDAVFFPRPEATTVVRGLGVPPGRLLMYAGRLEHDKDVLTFLRVGLRLQVLYDDLVVVVATHVADHRLLRDVCDVAARHPHVAVVCDPAPADLAALYTVADLFLTASTSRYETFGRACAEALACGCPVVAPRYDGFMTVLASPGGTLVAPLLPDRESAPVADEQALLRAAFDVLSSPNRPGRDEVAAAARDRHGRSRTISLLRYLAEGRVPPPAEPIAPAALRLPGAWTARLDELADRSSDELLSECWRHDKVERLTAYDSAFEVAVRRALCPAADEEPATCR